MKSFSRNDFAIKPQEESYELVTSMIKKVQTQTITKTRRKEKI